MNPKLSLYDDQMRRRPFPDRGQRVILTEEVTRLLVDIPDSGFGVIPFTQVSAEAAPALINREIQYFSKLGRAFHWRVYDTDTPNDLGDQLGRVGFRQGDREALLCFESDHAPLFSPPADIVIRKLSSVDDLTLLAKLDEAAGRDENSLLIRELTCDLIEAPQSISLYVAMKGEHPVAKGWVRFHEQRDFADLWGGETLRSHRGRGIYKALVAMRAQEAKQRGVRYLTTDALPSSQPILERMGFECLTHSTAYLWVPL